MRVHVSVLTVLETRHDNDRCRWQSHLQKDGLTTARDTMALSPHVGKGRLQAAHLAVGSWVFYHLPSRHWSPNSLHLEGDQSRKGQHSTGLLPWSCT